MKSQLSLLAIENGESFATHVRKRVKTKQANVAISKSLNLIMIMPDLIAEVRDASEDRTLSPEVRSLNQFLLVYFYHPMDFLPDDAGGLFGYLDDAYFVGRVYQRIRAITGKQVSASAKELAIDLTVLLEVVKSVIPKESRKIDGLIEELIRGKRVMFEELLSRN